MKIEDTNLFLVIAATLLIIILFVIISKPSSRKRRRHNNRTTLYREQESAIYEEESELAPNSTSSTHSQSEIGQMSATGDGIYSGTGTGIGIGSSSSGPYVSAQCPAYQPTYPTCFSPLVLPCQIRGPQGPQGPPGAVIYTPAAPQTSTIASNTSMKNKKALEATESTTSDYENAVCAGTIISVASSRPVEIQSLAYTGVSGVVSSVGLGGNAYSPALVGGLINLAAGAPDEINTAITIPRSGTIDSFAGFFSTATGLTLPGEIVTIEAELYQSPTPDNTFTPISGTTVLLSPLLTGNVPNGTCLNGALEGLSIPVTAQTRLLIVFKMSTAGNTLAQSVLGYPNGAINIL